MRRLFLTDNIVVFGITPANMKAILIDVVNRNVREVELPKEDNQAIYDLLGEDTTLMQVAIHMDNEDVIMVDEEGFFNRKSGVFEYAGAHQPYFMGNGLVIGGNDQGGQEDVKTKLEEIRAKVRFGLLVPKG